MENNSTTLTTKIVNETHFDIFWGTGWDNWARVQNNRGFLKQVAGEIIPKPVFATLIQTYSKKNK